MLYPGNPPFLGRAPSIMHYGSDYTFGNRKAYFNKMSHQQLRLETCPNFLFDEPWEGTVLAHAAQLSKQDALATEHLATLNAAFCRFYARIGCSPLPERCGGSTASAFVAQLVHERHAALGRLSGRGWASGSRGRRFGVARPGGMNRLPPFSLASIRQEAHIEAVQTTITRCRQRSCQRTVPSPSPNCPRSPCPRDRRCGLLSWPIRAKQWHAPHLVTQATMRRCVQAGRGWASAAKTHYSCIAARKHRESDLVSPGA
jgi:hypothetical protein